MRSDHKWWGSTSLNVWVIQLNVWGLISIYEVLSPSCDVQLNWWGIQCRISTCEASISTYEVLSDLVPPPTSYVYWWGIQLNSCNIQLNLWGVQLNSSQRMRHPTSYVNWWGIQCLISTHEASNPIDEASNSTHLNVWGFQLNAWGFQRLMSIDEASNVSFQRMRHPTQLMQHTLRWMQYLTTSYVNLLRDRTCYEVWSQPMRHPTRLMRSYLNLCGMQCLMCDVYEAVDEATYTRHIKTSYVWRLWGSWRGIQLDYWALNSTCAVCNVFCVTLITFMRQLTRHPSWEI